MVIELSSSDPLPTTKAKIISIGFDFSSVNGPVLANFLSSRGMLSSQPILSTGSPENQLTGLTVLQSIFPYTFHQRVSQGFKAFP